MEYNRMKNKPDITTEIVQFLKSCKYHPVTRDIIKFPENYDLYVLQSAVKFSYLSLWYLNYADSVYTLISKGVQALKNASL